MFLPCFSTQDWSTRPSATPVSTGTDRSGSDRDTGSPLAWVIRDTLPVGRVFDSLEPLMFDDPDHMTVSGQQNEVYEEWVFAAPMFRPLSRVFSVAGSLYPKALSPGAANRDSYQPPGSGRSLRRSHNRNWRFTCCATPRSGELAEVDELLVDKLAGISNDTDGGNEAVVTLVDCRLDILQHLIAAASDERDAATLIQQAIDLAGSTPMFRRQLLALAELAYRFGRVDDALELLDRAQMDVQLDMAALGYSMHDAISQRFRYWRLRHRIHRRSDSDDVDAVLESVPPSVDTPAGNSIAADAPVHRDSEGIEMAAEFDKSVRRLAAAAAATDEGAPYDSVRLWTVLTPALDVGHRLRQASSSASGVASHRPELLQQAVRVAIEHSNDAADRLSDRLGTRFTEQGERWPTTVRLSLGRQLHDAGRTPQWYASLLSIAEEEIFSGELDLSGRLNRIAELVTRHAALGRLDEAERLAKSLLHMSFGVGYRKDYQFDRWMRWFRTSVEAGIGEPIEEATWLARVLTAASPMTEGAPGEAAAELPGILAPRHPAAAVALFEYLVRLGEVRHLATLAKLIEGLCKGSTHEDLVAIEAMADVVTDLLAHADTEAHPGAARAVILAYRIHAGDQRANELAELMRSRIENSALPTTRSSWLEGLGVASVATSEVQDEPYGRLELLDGTQFTRGEARALIVDAATAVELRLEQVADSFFDWLDPLARLELSDDDLVGLQRAFDGSARRDGDVLVLIGRAWLDRGNAAAAVDSANAALEVADEDSWSRQWGSTRRRAHALAIHAGGAAETDRAWDDLGEVAGGRPWRSDLILGELEHLIEMLDPTLDTIALWAEIRTHLDGMAVTLDLDDRDPLGYQPIPWWVDTDSVHVERLGGDDSVARAVAVLLADHATHHAWLLRDGAIGASAAAIGTGYPELVATIERLVEASPPDEIVEALGRAVASAPDRSKNAASLVALNRALGQHPNQYIRDLSVGQDESLHPLPVQISA